MFKILLVCVFSCSAFALDFLPENVFLTKDGKTNFEGVRYEVNDGSLTDGVVLTIFFEKQKTPEWVDLFVINSKEEMVVICGLEGVATEGVTKYSVGLASDYLDNSELVIYEKGGKSFSLKFHQVKTERVTH